MPTFCRTAPMASETSSVTRHCGLGAVTPCDNDRRSAHENRHGFRPLHRRRHGVRLHCERPEIDADQKIRHSHNRQRVRSIHCNDESLPVPTDCGYVIRRCRPQHVAKSRLRRYERLCRRRCCPPPHRAGICARKVEDRERIGVRVRDNQLAGVRRNAEMSSLALGDDAPRSDALRRLRERHRRGCSRNRAQRQCGLKESLSINRHHTSVQSGEPASWQPGISEVELRFDGVPALQRPAFFAVIVEE